MVRIGGRLKDGNETLDPVGEARYASLPWACGWVGYA